MNGDELRRLMPHKDPAKHKAAASAAYYRLKATNPEIGRERRLVSRRAQRARGIPPGAYRKYLGLTHGRPTEAQRAQLRVILDELAAQPKVVKPRVVRARTMKVPGERTQRKRLAGSCTSSSLPPAGPTPSRDRGAHLIARLTHPPDCDCRLCFELRHVLPQS